ncbi:MAG: 3-hydroxybutyryl-CoA dehydrogenase [Oscillospiraceae bacterium]|nr:3-hydroxybutyryl-CoA dehydrogenase [Oscillospiraceae bacterium]
MKIAVLGAGAMGSGIAQTFAAAGHSVLLYDIKQEFADAGLAKITKGLGKLVEKGKMDENVKNAIVANITPTADIEALKVSEFVVEAVFENMQVKSDVFSKLNSICGENTIFASNTSSLSITEIANASGRPDKFIGMHFFNPAPVMKLVEIIKGVYTSDETFNACKELALNIGKDPVTVIESPGFVVNRILIPMINEAICVLSEGIASAEDIDKAMKLGANHPMGPLSLSDLIGNDVVLAIMNVLYTETGDSKYRACPLLKKMVRAKLLGRKTGKGFFDYQN